nr:hypothetical protein [Enterococcus sp. DIV0849a]
LILLSATIKNIANCLMTLIQNNSSSSNIVRKIGNSLDVILPKNSGIVEGESLVYQKIGNIIQLDLSEAQKNYALFYRINESERKIKIGNMYHQKQMHFSF